MHITNTNTKNSGEVHFKILPEISYKWNFWKDIKNEKRSYKKVFFSWLGIEFSVIINNGKY